MEALVVGILGLVLCQLLAPYAWSKGKSVVAEIDASPGTYSGRDEANIGRILGIVGSALLAFTLVVILIYGIGMALTI